ncbi:hypothetical protein [Clostridium sp. ZBS18]|uniref:hypothetical protein n=1 Tax=Clostridium sp. ZBS18 TaxID=2949967 RepID=UPI00207A01CE|nr:hypothetical protein [Clostridium sp. ZBS18]
MEDDLLFKGAKHLRLDDYFQDKILLNELQYKRRFSNVDKEMLECEKRIKEFLTALDEAELRQIIYLSLNLDNITDNKMRTYGK